MILALLFLKLDDVLLQLRTVCRVWVSRPVQGQQLKNKAAVVAFVLIQLSQTFELGVVSFQLSNTCTHNFNTESSHRVCLV